MDIVEHQIPFSLPLARLYMEEFEKVSHLYDYDPSKAEAYESRLKRIADSSHQDRHQVAEALADYNKRVGNEKGVVLLKRFLDSKAVMVLGGQQPGLMTGPLYSAYKLMTILSVAKREEKKLGVPVIPLFWIAGEDHDWDEVSHVYLPKGEGALKLGLSHPGNMRASVSHLSLRPEVLSDWIDRFFSMHPITSYTASLKAEVDRIAALSGTLSDFFARLLLFLFPDEPFLLMDSADPVFRRLEGEMFQRFLKEPHLLSDGVEEGKERVRALGMTPQIESEANSAHLFLYEHGGRILLEQHGDQFRSKRLRGRSWRREELVDWAVHHPERFSCNVVTRPLMQEYLFPVLAFVAGPGEISYWGLLRETFHSFGYTMPILIPRMAMTMVERSVQKLYDKVHLGFQDLFLRAEEALADWAAGQDTMALGLRISQAAEEIKRLYQPIVEDLSRMDDGLARFGEKNLSILLAQVTRLNRKVEQAFLARDREIFEQFMAAKRLLQPNGIPQERVYTPFTFINRYGLSWWEQFRRLSLVPNGLHKEIRL